MKRELDTRDTIRVVTSNNFLRAAGLEKTTLKARKLLYVALSQCQMNDRNFFEYSISAVDFANLMGIDPSHVWGEADELTDELMHGFIKYMPPGKKNFEKFQLFKMCKYEDSVLHFELSEDMTPVMLNLKQDFTQPLLKDFMHMRSNYSIEIWHLMQKEMQSKKPGTDKIEFYISLEELRKITGTQNKLKQLGEFKNRVLDKALREIKDNCGTVITYKNRKQGRSVVGFDFTATSEFDMSDYVPSPELLEKIEQGKQRIQEAKDRIE